MSAAAMQRMSLKASTSRPSALPVRGRLAALPARVARKSQQAARQCVVLRATAEGRQVAQAASGTENEWVAICRPEDLPKGVRKEVEVDGRQVLVFWYRNQLYAIEARSPAEGAYSEGFIRAKFTQDFCIECPGTGALFSLKDGSIQAWYPNNPVLRALTPPCLPLEIYPVKLAQDALYVDVSNARMGRRVGSDARGGANTSLENNNVFSVQPTVYFEGMDPTVESASKYAMPIVKSSTAPNPAVALASIMGIGALAVAGSAVALYYENVTGLAAFWVVMGSIGAYVGYRYVNREKA